MKRLGTFLLSLLVLVAFNSCGQTGTQVKNTSKMDTDKHSPVIGIIGSGNVGGTLGKKWAQAGYTVLFSSRHPEALSDLISQAGNNAKAVTVTEAARAGDVIVLAVPFKAEAQVSRQIQPYIKNKIVILCDNAYPGRDGDIVQEARQAGVAYFAQQHYYPEVKLVRAFSSLPVFEVGSATPANPVVVPYALDDTAIRPLVEKLIQAVDGTPRFTGSIKDSKSLDY